MSASRPTTRRWVAAVGLAALAWGGCSRDPRMTALGDGVELMARIVRSRVLVEAVRNADPQMRASTAAGAALSGGVTANFPTPPEGIAILVGEKPTESWSVVLIGDDAGKQVRIEGYSEDLQKPAIVETVAFPP